MAPHTPKRVSYRGSTYRLAAQPKFKEAPIQKAPRRPVVDTPPETFEDVANDLMRVYLKEDFDFQNNLIVSITDTLERLAPVVRRVKEVDPAETVTNLLNDLNAIGAALQGAKNEADTGNAWTALNMQSKSLSDGAAKMREHLAKLPESIKALQSLEAWTRSLEILGNQTSSAVGAIMDMLKEAVQ